MGSEGAYSVFRNPPLIPHLVTKKAESCCDIHRYDFHTRLSLGDDSLQFLVVLQGMSITEIHRLVQPGVKMLKHVKGALSKGSS